MRFNLKDQAQAGRALNYLLELTQNGKLAEVKRVSPVRSLSQNSYLHLLLAAFGHHFGYTLEESKLLYKQVNASIYRYQKKDKTFWRSSAEISKEDMATSIDRFMQKSEEQGCPLPLASNLEWLIQIENEAERSKYYL